MAWGLCGNSFKTGLVEKDKRKEKAGYVLGTRTSNQSACYNDL